jgi:BirA family transcriptional regulator, biotin operon repressor / biotin---[acetyl-CoA-carboxylase] ligase
MIVCFHESPSIDYYMSAKQQSFPFIKLDVIDSTNNYAMNLVKAGQIRNLTCIWTLDQNRGKGQRGNIWLSEAGKNLTCSVIFFPSSLKASENFYLSMTTCLASRKFLQLSCNNVQVKWPNDLYVAGKKSGGILIENTLEKQDVRASILGVGINLNQTEFPSEILNATSVLLNSGKKSDIEKSLLTFYSLLVENLQILDQKRYTEIKESYMESLYGLGVMLHYKDTYGEFDGIIQGIEDTGELLIKDSKGKIRKYSFKEVEMIV